MTTTQPMRRFFATFGAEHPMAKKIVGILAQDMNVATAAMFKTFGPKWAFVYNADDEEYGIDDQRKAYGLSLILSLKATWHGHNLEEMVSGDVTVDLLGCGDFENFRPESSAL